MRSLIATAGGELLAVFLATSAFGADASWTDVPGALRVRAGFDSGLPEAEIAPGDRRLTRLGRFRGGSIRPDSKRAGETSLAETVVSSGGKPGAWLRTSAETSLAGGLNARQGTVAVWIRHSEVLERGGLLLAGRSFLPGGALGELHWALGIGSSRGKAGEPPHGHLFVQTGAVGCVAKRPLPMQAWTHIIAVWDADRGAKLFVDGALQASTWDRLPEARPPVNSRGISRLGGRLQRKWTDGVVPAPVERLHIVAQAGSAAGGIDDLSVYDAALPDDVIGSLYAGSRIEQLAVRDHIPDVELRRRWLGWRAEQDRDLISVASGQPLTVRRVAFERAYEDLKASGHLAADGRDISLWPWWYHGYAFLEPRRLHLIGLKREPFDYIVARGYLFGHLVEGGMPKNPQGGRTITSLRPAPDGTGITRIHLPVPTSAESVTLVRERGDLAELDLYRVSRSPRAEVPGERAFYLPGADPPVPLPLSEVRREEFLTSYPPGDRRTLVASETSSLAPKSLEIRRFIDHHFMTPAAKADFPLSAVRLRLRFKRAPEPFRLHVGLHDPVIPWSWLARTDLRVEPGPDETSEIDVTLALPARILPRGEALWLTIVSERDLAIQTKPGDSPQLVLSPAKSEEANEGLLAAALASFRDSFEATSEPQPWAVRGQGVTMDPEATWWLRGAWPEVAHMQRLGRLLRQRFPAEERVKSWLYWIHPDEPKPLHEIPIPDAGRHPEWAVLARECMRLAGAVPKWWAQNRAAVNGELGNSPGDDTDLVADFVDTALIDDPARLLERTLSNLSDGVSDGRFTVRWGPNRGHPVIDDGLNSLYLDGLHAYEEGLNVRSQALLLEYGDPVVVERLMATARRYDGFLLTPVREGRRTLRGDRWGTDRPPTGDPAGRDAYLATHPGLMLLWWSRPPALLEVLTELGRGMLPSAQPKTLGRGGQYFFAGLYRITQQRQFLHVLLPALTKNRVAVPNPPIAPGIAALVPSSAADSDATLRALREDDSGRFEDTGFQGAAFDDTSYELAWLEWKLGGDKRPVIEALRALYRRLKFSLPALTEAELSGDRVAVPKQLISHLYLGGTAAGRMHLYPDHAVSYEDLGTNFAAWVLDNERRSLRILFYAFSGNGVRGRLKTWNLLPGRYRVRAGPDADGDDQLDSVVSDSEIELVRGDPVPIQIPATRSWIYEFTSLQDSTPLEDRGDAAVSTRDFHWASSDVLVAPIHNIGNVALTDVEVSLQATDGREIARKQIPLIDAPLDMQPRRVVTRWNLPDSEVVRSLTIVVDPNQRLEEITRVNNRADLPPSSVQLH